jgi:hypothetical protein
MRANGRGQPRGEVAPVAEVCWKRSPDFRGTELEESVTRATTEGALEPAQERARRLEGVVRGREQQLAAPGQRERRHENHPQGERCVRRRPSRYTSLKRPDAYLCSRLEISV